MVILLFKDKDNYTYVHMCIATPIVALANLRLLFMFLYSEYINHIQVFGFLPFSCPSHVQSPLREWPMPSNITAFVLGL
jgi:hypothetical protein